MPLQDHSVVEIRPSLRGRAQLPAVLFVAGVLLGATLQWLLPWNPSSRMARLDAVVPIPIGFVMVAGLGGWIAWTIHHERGKHRVRLTPDGIEVERKDGRYRVAYEEIDGVGTTPAGGVGIELIDFRAWSATQPDLPREDRMIADSTLELEGFDLVIEKRFLNRPAQEVFDLIAERMDD